MHEPDGSITLWPQHVLLELAARGGPPGAALVEARALGLIPP